MNNKNYIRELQAILAYKQGGQNQIVIILLTQPMNGPFL